jgi:sugar lactone lactonase YvrE
VHALPHRTVPLALLVLAACARGDTGADTTAADSARADTAAPALVGVIEGLSTPEGVRYDPDQDVYFVSNIQGNPSRADGNGFIARVRPDSLDAPQLDFVRGGRAGVTLNAPKGMALAGDTLWVADITAVRGFHRRTGRPVATVDLTGQGATFLNDVTVGGDGALYVTDTGIRFAADGSASHPGRDRVYRIAGREVTVAVEGDTLAGPNGITWDAAGKRFVIASFNGKSLFSWTPGGKPTPLATGPGGFDGVEVLADGRILVTSWTDSSLHVVDSTDVMTKAIGGVDAPADLGVDTRRSRVLVPLFNSNRVVVYGLP